MDLNEFLNTIFLKNGKYNKSQATKHWFEVRGYLNFYYEILKLTPYFKESEKICNKELLSMRITDILNKTLYQRRCKICNKIIHVIDHKWPSTCDNKNCKSKYHSIRCKEGNKTKDYSYLKNPELIKKRIESRRNNGRPWNTPESNLKAAKSNSETWKKIWSDPNDHAEYKKRFYNSRPEHSKKIKELIASGKFTPCITNSWANSKCKLLHVNNYEKFYRSSWDAAFQILNPDFEYEKLRIKYIGEDNKEHNYIVDFINDDKKILVEIKPDRINKFKKKYFKRRCCEKMV